MICARCGSDSLPDSRFCTECGGPLERGCSSCGTTNPAAAKFCRNCGNRLGADESPVAPASYTPARLAEKLIAEQSQLEARGIPDGERKTVTALFADIKGSMELIEDLDPEEARGLVDPALKIMMDAVHGLDGYVAQSTGDGIFALFGAPLAHEDHAQRALYAALRMQQGIRRYAEELRSSKGVNLQVRVGANTGEVVLRSIRRDDLHADYTPVGHSTGMAARMESLATPGSILVSDSTFKLTQGYFEFRPLGQARVKGVSEPVSIHEVLGIGPLRTRLQLKASQGLSRFVGRDQEIAQLSRAAELARGGHGQIVAAVGEAGVGKSRLFYEFRMKSGSEWLTLETFSVSHGKASAYLPLIELLKDYFGIKDEDDDRKRREKITGKILTLDSAVQDVIPRAFALLGVGEQQRSVQQSDPDIQRRETFDAFKRLLLRESLNQPVILVFEDLHWLDAETEGFLRAMADSINSARVLLLVNYRPEYRHKWSNRSNYTQLRLEPLGKEIAVEMLSAMLGADSELDSLKRVIISKADGNPLYLEEIVQALFEHKVLERNGKVTIKRPLDQVHIPPTVQGLIAARIDRLDPQEKLLLETLAVLGKEFTLPLVEQVFEGRGDRIRTMLTTLREGEFIYEQPAFPDPEYVFKHALTQEVAYNLLLAEQRKRLHERTGMALEKLYADRIEDRLVDLAHHYGRSGNGEKGIEYLRRAGFQSLARSAQAEAIGYYQRAIELLPMIPDENRRMVLEIDIRDFLSVAMTMMLGYASEEVEASHDRSRELCALVQTEPARLFSVQMGSFGYYLTKGRLRDALATALRLIDLAEQTQEQRHLMYSNYTVGFAMTWMGDLDGARKHLELSNSYFDPRFRIEPGYMILQDPHVTSIEALSLALWFAGFPDKAATMAAAGVAEARSLNHPFTIAFAEFFAAAVYALRDDLDLAEQHADAAIAISLERGFPFWIGCGRIVKGWALTARGRVDEGIDMIGQATGAVSSTGASLIIPHSLHALSDALLKVGMAERALVVSQQALEEIDRNGQELFRAEHLRFKAEAAMRLGDRAAAMADLQKALETAKAHAAAWVQLRCAIAFARAQRGSGEQNTARVMLIDARSRLQEGFETPDFREATNLLQELA